MFQELNLAVVGSQIVGLVPLQALMETADYYMNKSNLFILEEDQKLRLVGDLTLKILQFMFVIIYRLLFSCNSSCHQYGHNHKMSHVMRKPMFWFSTWSDTNQDVQLPKMARGLKFRK